MKDADVKAFVGIFFFFFIILELPILFEGKARLLGEAYTGDIVMAFALMGIATSGLGMYLIFKDKVIGYVILISSVAITLTVYFGDALIID